MKPLAKDLAENGEEPKRDETPKTAKNSTCQKLKLSRFLKTL